MITEHQLTPLKTQTFTFQINSNDVDSNQIVHHTRYLAFFDKARDSFFNGFQELNTQLECKHLTFVVKKIDIDYKLPAKINDSLTIQSSIIELSDLGIVFNQKLLRNEQLLAEALVIITTIDLKAMKPVSLPSYVKNFLNI